MPMDIDEALLIEAMKLTGLASRKEVVEEALRTLIRLKSQERVKELRGKLRWDGDLDAMRDARFLGNNDSRE